MRSMGRLALLGIAILGACAPVQARPRFGVTPDEELLRRSQTALASPDHSENGVQAKARALVDLAELRNPPANAAGLAVETLRGPSGYRLSLLAGRLLLRLDADGWQPIAQLTMANAISEQRSESAMRPFVEANEARLVWQKRKGVERAKAFATLVQLRALRHEEFAAAIADRDPEVRCIAPLAAGFLSLGSADWEKIATLLHDDDARVRQNALRALMEDSVPDPAGFDDAVFAVRYDPAVSGDVLKWFEHAELDQEQFESLMHDLRTRSQEDQQAAMSLLKTLLPGQPERLLSTMAAFASAPDSPPTAAEGALSIFRAAVDRLSQTSLEEQLLARVIPLVRDRSFASPVHDVLLSAVAKMRVDTSALTDIFIRDFAHATGGSLLVQRQCLEHAAKVNPASFARAIWEAQHDGDPQVVQAARAYTSDQRLSGVWMLALTEGKNAEQHEALDAFEEHGVNRDGWPAVAERMKSGDADLRRKALRVLVRMAALQEQVDADGRVLVRDAILAALKDPDPRLQRAGLALAGNACVTGRPEARDAVLGHLNDSAEDTQAMAWNALAAGLPGGVFGDIREVCPDIDAMLKQAIWYGKPAISGPANRIWDALHPGTSRPWPPGQALLLLTLIGLCTVFAALLQCANWRERAIGFEEFALTDDQQEAELAARAMGTFTIIATVGVALVALWAAATQTIAMRYGVLCAVSVLMYLLAGTAMSGWAKLIRTGRLLDRLAALVLSLLVTVPSLGICVMLLIAAFRGPDDLPAVLVLSQVAAVVAVASAGVLATRRIIQTFRTPPAPPVPQPVHRQGSTRRAW